MTLWLNYRLPDQTNSIHRTFYKAKESSDLMPQSNIDSQLPRSSDMPRFQDSRHTYYYFLAANLWRLLSGSDATKPILFLVLFLALRSYGLLRVVWCFDARYDYLPFSKFLLSWACRLVQADLARL